MFRDNAEFCGLQKSVLDVIIKNKSLILVVIDTDTDKSLLFQLSVYS
jgi:hypothetical protein